MTELTITNSEFIKNLSYNISFNQPQIIRYISYPERLFIAFVCIISWYLFCVVVKRNYKNEIAEFKEDIYNFIFRRKR